MDRIVVLVDAGYLLSQAVKVLSAKKSRSRADLQLNDADGLINMLVSKAKAELQNDNLLRVYWYDGLKGGLSAEHKAIIEVDDVQLRTGTINGQGQQKGVDSKIVIDLIELASNHAICDAVVVTGDGDLAIGIELSQRRGIRVAVLGVEDLNIGVTHSQSPEVTNVADRVIRIGSPDLSPFLSYSPKPVSAQNAPKQALVPSAAASVPTPAATVTSGVSNATLTPQIDTAVKSFIAAQKPPFQASVMGATGAIDKAVDRSLLYHVYTTLGRALSDVEKRHARAVFRTLLKTP
jgi:uncharacterized LabA/DUF88 family protein